jgi:hypothetical protein
MILKGLEWDGIIGVMDHIESWERSSNYDEKE